MRLIGRIKADMGELPTEDQLRSNRPSPPNGIAP
jgi:hypothetical protein